MPRFYFDVIENDLVIVDDQGTVLPDMHAARAEAAQALAEAARDTLAETAPAA